MKRVYYLLVLSIFVLFPMGVLAVPAYPGLVKIQQPNGEEVSVYLRGDEKVHWMESPDGYSLMYNKDKQIVYATTDETGDMIPSSIVYQNLDLRSSATGKQLADIPKNLRYSASQVNILKKVWNLADRSADNASLRATTGTVHAICALVEFPDKSLTKTNDDFYQLFNTKGYGLDGAQGSVRDFYYENSYGKLELIITVVGPYPANHPVSYYGENSKKNGETVYDNIEHIVELAKEAANYAFNQPGINVNEYDNDGDGYIDAFHFIYAGRGEESGGDANTIWAHENRILPSITIKGKKLDTYSCSPELRSNTGITRIGVICHEMGHIFGAPDFYDVDGESGGDFLGTGNWDLMAGGSWNGSGASPAHINMYQKIKLGWVNPVTLNAPQTVSNMLNSAENPVAYIYNTSVSGEYYVLENRQQKKFDSYVPGSGLLIYHVSLKNIDISLNEVNIAHPQKMYPVCASSNYKIPNASPASYGSINSAGCPFPGTSGNTSFTDYTTPSAITWNGTYSAKPVTEISEQGGLISFKFMQPGAAAVNNFTLTKNGSNIQLNWNKPSDNVLAYNIYRNDRFFIKLMGANSTSYSQNVNPGSYTYCVTACYAEDESAQRCQSVTVAGNPDEYYPPVNNLSAIINGNTVELKWDSPADWLSFTDDPAEPYFITGGFSAVVHFSEDDLKRYVGSKLYQVRFYVDDANAQHTIQVWHFSESQPSVNPLVSQVVGNVGTGIVTVNLNTPLTIEAGKKLRIGISTQTNWADSGPMIPGKNFYIYNGQWYEIEEDDDFNWYIAGYLKFDDNLGAGVPNAPAKYVVYRDGAIHGDNILTGYFRDDVVSNGKYLYCVSAVYGGRESEWVCIQTSVRTGIDKLNPADDMKTYPNPVKQGDILTIDLGNDFAGAKLLFYSVSGQLLRESTVSEPVYRQKVDLAQGIYILQIRKNTQIINRKIVVE